MRFHHLRLTPRYMGVSKNDGAPKWMIYFMENPIKMDDLGVPLFLGNIHILVVFGRFNSYPPNQLEKRSF